MEKRMTKRMTKSVGKSEYWVKTMRRVHRPGVEITLTVDSDPLVLTAGERRLVEDLEGIMIRWAEHGVIKNDAAVQPVVHDLRLQALTGD